MTDVNAYYYKWSSMVDSADILFKNIERRLSQLGMNDSDLAREIGVPRQQMSQWMNSKRVPSLQSIDRIATALKTETYALLRDIEAEIIAGKDVGEEEQSKFINDMIGNMPVRELVFRLSLTLSNDISLVKRDLMNLIATLDQDQVRLVMDSVKGLTGQVPLSPLAKVTKKVKDRA